MSFAICLMNQDSCGLTIGTKNIMHDCILKLGGDLPLYHLKHHPVANLLIETAAFQVAVALAVALLQVVAMGAL